MLQVLFVIELLIGTGLLLLGLALGGLWWLFAAMGAVLIIVNIIYRPSRELAPPVTE